MSNFKIIYSDVPACVIEEMIQPTTTGSVQTFFYRVKMKLSWRAKLMVLLGVLKSL